MNTFAIKTYFAPVHINGQFIGKSDDDQYVYVYRSHKIFKDSNPDLVETGNYTIYDNYARKKESKLLLRDEFKFDKNNVCPCCGGLKYWYRVTCDKPVNGNVMYDEDGFVLFDEEVNVNCICNDGTYVGYLNHELEMQKRQVEDERKKYVELRDYIRKTSTCKTCEGHQERTLGLCECKECGLPGNGVWPG